MKILNKDVFFSLVPKLNILLILCAVLLTVKLYSSVSRTYDSSNIQAKRKIAKPLELMMGKETISEPAPLFQEDIFKKKELFNLATNKNLAPEKRSFVLLGVSSGKKNIAVIKDTKDNKDYYCSEGDLIGDFQVKEIFKDKVVLKTTDGILEITR